jgi:uncharacterized protein with GYD domain
LTKVPFRPALDALRGKTNGRIEMAIFVTKAVLPANTSGVGLAKPEDRQAAISRLCEQAGGKLLNLYFTLGQHEFLLISEMPNARAATVISLAASDGGGIQDVATTQAFTTAEAKALFEQAGNGRSCRKSSTRCGFRSSPRAASPMDAESRRPLPSGPAGLSSARRFSAARRPP